MLATVLNGMIVAGMVVLLIAVIRRGSSLAAYYCPTMRTQVARPTRAIGAIRDAALQNKPQRQSALHEPVPERT